MARSVIQIRIIMIGCLVALSGASGAAAQSIAANVSSSLNSGLDKTGVVTDPTGIYVHASVSAESSSTASAQVNASVNPTGNFSGSPGTGYGSQSRSAMTSRLLPPYSGSLTPSAVSDSRYSVAASRLAAPGGWDQQRSPIAIRTRAARSEKLKCRPSRENIAGKSSAASFNSSRVAMGGRAATCAGNMTNARKGSWQGSPEVDAGSASSLSIGFPDSTRGVALASPPDTGTASPLAWSPALKHGIVDLSTTPFLNPTLKAGNHARLGWRGRIQSAWSGQGSTGSSNPFPNPLDSLPSLQVTPVLTDSLGLVGPGTDASSFISNPLSTDQ